MIKWSTLQLNLMPVIAMQTDSAIERLRQSVEKVNEYGHAQDIQELNAIRKSIINRIQSFDRFYEQKYHDETVDIFHMLKLKLQRAIFKLGHIDNETVCSEKIANMFNNDSLEVSEHKIRETGNSKSNKKIRKDQSQTFNQSNQNLFGQESRTHQMHWMKTGNTSFDFQSPYDQPLFKRSRSRQSPSTPSLRKNNFKKSKEKISQNIKTSNSQQLQPPHKKIIQEKQHAIRNIKNVAEKRQQIKKMVDKSLKSQSVLEKVPIKNAKDSYKQIKAPQKYPLHIEKSLKNAKKNLYNKTQERVKTQGNISYSEYSKKGMKKPGKGEKQAIIQQQHEQNQSEDNEFRFTIKMTKQQYMSLQALRDELIKSGQLG